MPTYPRALLFLHRCFCVTKAKSNLEVWSPSNGLLVEFSWCVSQGFTICFTLSHVPYLKVQLRVSRLVGSDRLAIHLHRNRNHVGDWEVHAESRSPRLPETEVIAPWPPTALQGACHLAVAPNHGFLHPRLIASLCLILLEATRNKCIATSNKCLTTSNKKRT